MENGYKNLPSNINVNKVMRMIGSTMGFNYNNLNKSIRGILSGFNRAANKSAGIVPMASGRTKGNNAFYNKMFTFPITARYAAVANSPKRFSNAQIIQLLMHKGLNLNKSGTPEIKEDILTEVGKVLKERKINSATYKKIMGTYNK